MLEDSFLFGPWEPWKGSIIEAGRSSGLPPEPRLWFAACTGADVHKVVFQLDDPSSSSRTCRLCNVLKGSILRTFPGSKILGLRATEWTDALRSLSPFIWIKPPRNTCRVKAGGILFGGNKNYLSLNETPYSVRQAPVFWEAHWCPEQPHCVRRHLWQVGQVPGMATC